jgi:hypothetical protein
LTIEGHSNSLLLPREKANSLSGDALIYYGSQWHGDEGSLFREDRE